MFKLRHLSKLVGLSSRGLLNLTKYCFQCILFLLPLILGCKIWDKSVLFAERC